MSMEACGTATKGSRTVRSPKTSSNRARYASCAALALFLQLAVGRQHQRPGRAQRRRVVSGSEGLVGLTAEVRRALDPEGAVFVAGEHVLARGRSTRIDEEELRHACVAAATKLWQRL